jgi:hypothetical protein
MDILFKDFCCGKKKYLIFLIAFCFGPCCQTLHAGTTEKIAWKSIETKYTFVFYQSEKDLAKFCSKVKFGPGRLGLRAFFSRQRRVHLPDTVAKKTDALFEKVQKILGMQKKVEKVRINIYPNKERLHDAYSKLYRQDCNIRAWYRYANNTIYLNANDLHEGVLAHELTHAVVDNYLLVRPPHATAEIIARYVDSHLTRRIRSYDTAEMFSGFSH